MSLNSDPLSYRSTRDLPSNSIGLTSADWLFRLLTSPCDSFRPASEVCSMQESTTGGGTLPRGCRRIAIAGPSHAGSRKAVGKPGQFSSQILIPQQPSRPLFVRCSLPQPAKTLVLSFLLHQPAHAHHVTASVAECPVSMSSLYQNLFKVLTTLWGCRSGRARSRMLHAKQQASSCR